MEAIVLAGGLGTRLRAVVPNLPKPMAPISGRPFLEILLGTLAEKGFDRVVVSLGYMADSVVSSFRREVRGHEISCTRSNGHRWGPEARCGKRFGRCDSDHVFVLNGDTYLDLEIDGVEAQWQRDHVPLIVAREVPDTSRYGRLNTAGPRVVGFVSKGVARCAV